MRMALLAIKKYIGWQFFVKSPSFIWPSSGLKCVPRRIGGNSRNTYINKGKRGSKYPIEYRVFVLPCLCAATIMRTLFEGPHGNIKPDATDYRLSRWKWRF